MSDNNYNDIIPSNGNYRPDDHRPSHSKSPNQRLIVSLIAILVLILIGLVLLIYFKFNGKSSESREKQAKATVSATTPIPSDEKPAEVVVSRSHSNDIQAVPAEGDTDEVGEVLLRYHILTAGETIETVAELYGLDVRTIKSVNRNTDMPGVLRIPTRDGMMYTVKEGDTLIKIISKYRLNLTASQLSQVNGISETDALVAGSELFIPLI